MLHTKFQASELSSSGEDYILFLVTKDPPQMGQFRPQDHHLNELGVDSLDNASYQISNP